MATAVITGGAGGMGLATAKIMGRDHRIVVADVRQERVDAAVAAGVSPQTGSAELILRLNAVGTIHVTRTFLETAAAGDTLVNVASIAGHMRPAALEPRRTYRLAHTDVAKFEQKLTRSANRLPKKLRPGAAYGVSKAFVIWYTREIAAEFGEKGARAVSVSPGSFDTAMGRLEEKSGAGKMLEFAALKRFGTPDEIAEVLAFCAGDKAGYLTGTDILVDGGTRAGLDLKGMIAMARGV